MAKRYHHVFCAMAGFAAWHEDSCDTAEDARTAADAVKRSAGRHHRVDTRIIRSAMPPLEILTGLRAEGWGVRS